MDEFRKELEHLINKHSKENGSNTPDFILADYLTRCLDVFDEIIMRREQWFGRKRKIGSGNATIGDVPPPQNADFI